MKKSLPIAIGIAVFLAVVAGWVYTLPGILRHNGTRDGFLSDFGAASRELYENFAHTGTAMESGLKKIDALIKAQTQKEATLNNLKAKIVAKEKLKAALKAQVETSPAPAAPR